MKTEVKQLKYSGDEINNLLDKIPELERKITELENKLGTQVIYTLDGTTLNIDTK